MVLRTDTDTGGPPAWTAAAFAPRVAATCDCTLFDVTRERNIIQQFTGPCRCALAACSDGAGDATESAGEGPVVFELPEPGRVRGRRIERRAALTAATRPVGGRWAAPALDGRVAAGSAAGAAAAAGGPTAPSCGAT